MVRSVAGDLPEQVKNNQSVNLAAGNGGQKMSQYSWFTVYESPDVVSYRAQDQHKYALSCNQGPLCLRGVSLEAYYVPFEEGPD